MISMTPKDAEEFRRTEGSKRLEEVLFKIETAQILLESASGDLSNLLNVDSECRSARAVVTLIKDFWHKINLRRAAFATAGDGPVVDMTTLAIEEARRAKAAAEDALCGRVYMLSPPDAPKRPCIRPAGHGPDHGIANYCQDADGHSWIYGAGEDPAAPRQPR